MFDNKDYDSYTHGMMMGTIALGYNTVFEYSKKLGITWVNITLSRKFAMVQNPPLTPDPTILYCTFFLLILSQYITLHRCIQRIKTGEVSFNIGIKKWFFALVEYFIAFIAVLIVTPPLLRALRGW